MKRSWPLLILILCRLAEASAQQPQCDPDLQALAGSPYSYGPRGDRCEGVYAQQVGGTILSVASLTAGFEDYNLDSARSLRFTWPTHGDSALRIRVRGIQPELYYGMDVTRPAGARSYDWPIALLSSLKIHQPDIGVLGWTARKVASGWKRVYVPLQITQSITPARRGSYFLVLYPGAKLQEVFVTVGPAGPDGKPVPGKLVWDHKPQNQGFYPAERPVRIKLPVFRTPGLYYLEISATLPNGSPVAVPSMLVDAPGP